MTRGVAGGVAGVRFGVVAIPRRWRAQLRGQELFVTMVEELVTLTA